MKKTMLIAVSSALAAFVLAGPLVQPAQAQKARVTRQADDGITIIIIPDFMTPDDFQRVPQIYRYPSTQTRARAQEEIANNPAIRALLQRRGIPARNVNAIQTAMNGGKVVYVK